MSLHLNRRQMLASSLVTGGLLLTGWRGTLAEQLKTQSPHRHCILLWMTGGPAQTDTFDLKPGHANGGPFKEIATSAPGLRFSEHLPLLAQHGDKLAVIRSMSTREGDHDRGTYLLRTGRSPGGPVEFPTLGSVISKELGTLEQAMPHYVRITPRSSFAVAAAGPGFLGPQFAPLEVAPTQVIQPDPNAFPELGVENLQPPAGVSRQQQASRLDLLRQQQAEFRQGHAVPPVQAHDTVLNRAAAMAGQGTGNVFDLSTEPAELREKYGRNTFGQGCLLARRLVEQGVSFVEVVLGDFGRWDTHTDNFTTVQTLSQMLDAGWASLMSDLSDRGLLDTTTILWMGEFGRTPRINGSAGRDHYPRAWSTVLAGGGIQGGQAYGKTSAGGDEVEDKPLDAADLIATLCGALQIEPKKQNLSDINRPFRIAEGKPAAELLASG